MNVEAICMDTTKTYPKTGFKYRFISDWTNEQAALTANGSKIAERLFLSKPKNAALSSEMSVKMTVQKIAAWDSAIIKSSEKHFDTHQPTRERNFVIIAVSMLPNGNPPTMKAMQALSKIHANGG